MAGIKTIPLNATIATTEDHYLFTLFRVRRSSHTKDLISEVEVFNAKIDAAKAEERSLIAAEAEAAAGMQFADRDIDDSVNFVAANIDMKSLLGVRLFGDLRPSELKRPLLGGQLAVMSGWPEPLASSNVEVLRNHTPILAQRLATASAVVEEKKKASDDLSNFRSVGGRVKLNEAFNAFRKSLYGKLGQIQHDNPALGAGWAESFFLPSRRPRPSSRRRKPPS